MPIDFTLTPEQLRLRADARAFSVELLRCGQPDPTVAAGDKVELANELYLRGLGDFLSVLEAQKSRYELEDELAHSETSVVVNVVALYKALGGGW